MGGLKGMFGPNPVQTGTNLLGMGMEMAFKKQAMDLDMQQKQAQAQLEKEKINLLKMNLALDKEKLEVDKTKAEIDNLLKQAQAEGLTQEKEIKARLLDIAMPSGRRPMSPQGLPIQRTPEDKMKRMLPLLTALKGDMPAGIKMGEQGDNYNAAWSMLGAGQEEQSALAGIKPPATALVNKLQEKQRENYPAEYMNAVEKALETKNIAHVNNVQKKYGMSEIKNLDDINQNLSEALDNLAIGKKLSDAGLPFVISRDKPGALTWTTQPQMGITKDILTKYGNDAILMFAKLKPLMQDRDKFFHVPVPEFYRIYDAILRAKKDKFSDNQIINDYIAAGYDGDLIREMLKLK